MSRILPGIARHIVGSRNRVATPDRANLALRDPREQFLQAPLRRKAGLLDKESTGTTARRRLLPERAQRPRHSSTGTCPVPSWPVGRPTGRSPAALAQAG